MWGHKEVAAVSGNIDTAALQESLDIQPARGI